MQQTSNNVFLYYPNLKRADLFTKYIPGRVAKTYCTVKMLSSKLQRTANIVILCYPYSIMANLFTKDTPPRVAQKCYAEKKLTKNYNKQLPLCFYITLPCLLRIYC